jgi:phosphatidylglycerol---prolipoprotein diacylglyceryl transferase
MDLQQWGVRPVLFTLGGIAIPSYGFFVLLGLLAGLLVIYYQTKRQRTFNGKTFYIVSAALIGGIIGAKIPVWVANADAIVSSLPNCYFLLSGRSLVGGIIGGTLAVWLVKRKMQIKSRLGNALAPGIALGLAIGRIGCFLRGCCFGEATSFPWGVNFGDGISRHPTQLYESAYLLVVFIILLYAGRVIKTPGRVFDLFIMLYFIFRFGVEFIRVDPPVFIGLTIVQFISLGIVLYRGTNLTVGLLKKDGKEGQINGLC